MELPRLERTRITVTTHEQAAEEDRRYWWARTGIERLEALEQMRRVHYGCEEIMTILPTDFRDLVVLLNKNNVDYLLVGGYAVSFHGYPRATIDFDVWVGANQENASKVAEVLEEFGFGPREEVENLLAQEGQVVRMGVPPTRLEFITSASGLDFQECLAKKVVAEIDGVQVNVIDLASLRKNKKAAGRHKDLSDLENLPETGD